MINNIKKVNDWAYIKDVNNVIFQAFSSELFDQNTYPATLEYYFTDINNLKIPKMNVNGQEFYRIGIKYNVDELKNMGFEHYIGYSSKVNNNIVCPDISKIKSILTPEQGLEKILNNKIYVNHFVRQDLIYLLTLLKKCFSDKFIKNIGVEGSICIGVSNKNSDIDLLVDGKNNFFELLNEWKRIIKSDAKLVNLLESSQAQKEMYDNRKEYIPYTREEIIFHESRKMFSYIITEEGLRKINLVGKLNEDEEEYYIRKKQYFDNYKFYPIGLCEVGGVVKSSRYSYFIPSIYDVKINELNGNNNLNVNNIKYIIDYIGSYYMQMLDGEDFRCVGMLEQISYNDHLLDSYRISLNPWNNYNSKKMYLKKVK